MNEDTIARMTDDGSTATVIHSPQCVNCKHNLGGMKCDALATKPVEYMMNQEDCPMYIKEK